MVSIRESSESLLLHIEIKKGGGARRNNTFIQASNPLEGLGCLSECRYLTRILPVGIQKAKPRITESSRPPLPLTVLCRQQAIEREQNIYDRSFPQKSGFTPKEASKGLEHTKHMELKVPCAV